MKDKNRKSKHGWKWTQTYSYCPLHRKIVQCVLVSWMHIWLRCPDCLLKLPSTYSFDEPIDFLGVSRPHI